MRKILFTFSIILLAFFWFSQLQLIGASPTGLLINEIMPDPAGNDSLYEWIELYNSGSGNLNLADYKIGSSALPGAIIASGDYMILAKDIINFKAKYTASANVLAFNMSLTNSGGSLSLKDSAGTEIQNFSYGQSSEEKSFELLNGNCLTVQINILGSTVGQANNSCPVNTTVTPTVSVTPGATIIPTPTAFPTLSSVNYSNLIIISKIYAYPDSGNEWLELTNLDNVDINLHNWVIGDKTNNKYIVPAVILQPNQSFRIFPNSVSLNNDGDVISLTDPAGNQIDIFNYPKSSKGETFSLADASGLNEVTPTLTPTPKAGNSTTNLINSPTKLIEFAVPRIYHLI
jgi:hypothetical protein